MGDLLSDFAQWLKDVLLWIPRKLFQEIMEGLSSLLDSIPVPDFFSNLASAWANISPQVLFYLSPFELGYGLTVIGIAYGLRFLIRRIPIIG
ncbi:MAG: hypothetical protein RPT95_13620 [Candidatus Sedimenticola sp. (ex Thyasira tokunagai)]